MKKKIILLSFVCLTIMACTTKPRPYFSSSILIHSQSFSKPEVNLQTPLGEVEAGLETQSTAIFVRHTSSIPQKEKGQGIQSAGIKYKFGGWGAFKDEKD